MDENKVSGKFKEIAIPIGGLEIGKNGDILQTFVGSCVAICIYDQEKKIGGMAHVMLPKNKTGKTTKNTTEEGKFADDAINRIIERLENIDCNLKLQAKIVGGAKIFFHENETEIFDIGRKNIIETQSILKNRKIPIVSQLIGERNGRWVRFDCNSQKITIKEKGEEKII